MIVANHHRTRLSRTLTDLNSGTDTVTTSISVNTSLSTLFDRVGTHRNHLSILITGTKTNRLTPLNRVARTRFSHTFGAGIGNIAFAIRKTLALVNGNNDVIVVNSATSVGPNPNLDICNTAGTTLHTLIHD